MLKSKTTEDHIFIDAHLFTFEDHFLGANDLLAMHCGLLLLILQILHFKIRQKILSHNTYIFCTFFLVRFWF